jgi:AraC-like DNA-binding protein
MSTVGTPHPVPTVPASELRNLLRAFDELGYDPHSLVVAAGLDTTDLDDPDLRLPCTIWDALLSQAQRARFTPNIACRIAMRTTIGAFPLLDYLIVTSDTVGAGLHQLRRYLQLTGNPVAIEISEESSTFRFACIGSPLPFAVEFLCTLVILNLRQETDGKFTARRVSFSHQPDDAPAIVAALGCPVDSAASWNGLLISRDNWNLPLRRRDAVLRSVLEQQADALLARLPREVGVVADLQRVLASHQAGTDLAIGAAARLLATSARTLQRRLAEAGTSYQEVVDRWRKEAAAHYLTHAVLPICEIAYLLGYAEAASFHRAFKRWHGTTPEMFRKRMRQATTI